MFIAWMNEGLSYLIISEMESLEEWATTSNCTASEV